MIACSNRVILIKMAKKVNSISLRIGKRLSWNHIWTTNKCYKATKAANSITYNSNIQSLLAHVSNFNTVYSISTNVSSRYYSYMLRSSEYTSIFDSLKVISKDLNKKQINTKDITNITNNSIIEVYNTNIEKKTIQRLKESNSLLVLDAQVLANYITTQIVASDNLRSNFFRFDITNGIAKTTTTVLKKFQLMDSALFSGLKVECSGKWKQTSAGRKQSLKFTVGKVHTQKINQILSYGTSTINTRFGSCCVKVWLCFKEL